MATLQSAGAVGDRDMSGTSTVPRPRRGQHGQMLRVRPHTHAALKELAEQEQQPITQVIERLVHEELQRMRLRALNESFARLKADPERWGAYQADSADLEGTLADGLDDYDEDEALEGDRSREAPSTR